MKLLVVTYPYEVEDEAEKITRLFEEGLEVLHFRKPDWTIDDYEGLLKKIPAQYYKRMVIHSHFKLIEKYNLRGVHFRSQYLKEVKENMIKDVFHLATRRNISISASMHSIEEIRTNKWKFNYVFLSPLFDSISKEGYSSVLEPALVEQFIKEYKSPMQIIALGGICEKNIRTVVQMGFSGAALLGAIWNEGTGVDRFKTIKELVKI